MRRIWVVLPLMALFLAAPGAALAVVTQPPPPYDPSPLDGDTEYLINQASGLQAEARGADVVDSVRSFSHLSQRWAMTKLRSGHWKISNVGTGRCLEAAPARVVVLRACRVGVAAQAWSFSYVGNGYSTIANAETRLVLDVAPPRAS